jgi:hypothetical protein
MWRKQKSNFQKNFGIEIGKLFANLPNACLLRNSLYVFVLNLKKCKTFDPILRLSKKFWSDLKKHCRQGWSPSFNNVPTQQQVV